MGKVLVSASHFDTLCKEAYKLLTDNGHEVIFDPEKPFPAYSYEELKDILPDMDAAIIGLDNYDEKTLALGTKLKVVTKFGVGVDNIDLDAAKRLGIYACNCPGQNSNAVAELTIGFIICVLRRLVPLHKSMEESKWLRSIGEEMEGRTVGLYGFGVIGQLVAGKLRNFDVNIIACDILNKDKEAKALGVRMVSQDELVATADILSLHAPATSENNHVFSKATFSKMKDGAYLINSARGALVDIDDLAAALNSGKLSGAALDAFEAEPLPADCPIFKCDNVVLAPHTGAETYEAYRKVSLSAANNVIEGLSGKVPVNCVNK